MGELGSDEYAKVDVVKQIFDNDDIGDLINGKSNMLKMIRICFIRYWHMYIYTL